MISYHPTYTITVNTQEMLLWIPEPDMVHESGNGILLIVLNSSLNSSLSSLNAQAFGYTAYYLLFFFNSCRRDVQ